MASNTGLHSLSTIIKRLEAATSRLEDIASAPGGFNLAPVDPSTPGIQGSPFAAPPPPPPPPPPAHAAPEVPPSVIAFDERIMKGKVGSFVQLSAGLGVAEMAGLVETQYKELCDFLRLVASCKKPDEKTIAQLLTPLQTSIEAISRAKEASRRDREWAPHWTLVAEGAPAVSWVVTPKPSQYMADIKEPIDYYGNRIIKEFKEKDQKHVEWTRAYTNIINEMNKYVAEFHPTALTWNVKDGITVDEYKSRPSGASQAGVPPPPPPPPPATATPASQPAPAGGAAAVFAEINRGADVTKGLRKVDKSEMTHKNPALRAGSVVPASSGAGVAKKPVKPTKPQALAGKKPPKFALEGTKWLVEYQENEPSFTLEEIERNQSVNIFGCKNSTIIIKGKVNAVTLVNCTKTSVLVDSVVSSISVTSSPSFTIQVTGTASMIQLDSTDSGQIYLSKDSLHAEITTAKCSAINVSLPVEGEEEGVFEEQAVPEMLKTVVKDGKLVTTVVEHVG